jgi:hypothetical protein
MKVFIGVDPHTLSATIEVVDDRDTVWATGRFGRQDRVCGDAQGVMTDLLRAGWTLGPAA